jgi:hydrogenase-4 component F
MAVAVPFILVQKNFRQMLAYSSIDHSGIMVLALGFAGPLGVLGMFLHKTFHSITKPLLFFCVGNVQQHLKTELFHEAKGEAHPLDAPDRCSLSHGDSCGHGSASVQFVSK